MPRTPHTSRRVGHRSRTLLVLLLAVLPLAVTQPAVAHDVLIAGSPADGATVTAVPATVDLTFSNDLLPAGAIVEVRDPSGVNRAIGAPTVAGASVSVAVDPAAPGGGYTVVWRVVSSDGHPIEGSYGFTVDAPAPTPTPTPTSEPSPTTTPTATATVTAALATPAPGAGLIGSLPGGVVLAVAVASIGAVVAAVVLGARRQR